MILIEGTVLKHFIEDDQFGVFINFLCFSVDIDDMPEVSSGIGGRRSSHSTAKKVSHVSHTSRICALTYSPLLYLSLSLVQLFHEEMVLQWILVHPLSKPLVLKNAWFFFEVLVCVSDQTLIIVISLLLLSLSLSFSPDQVNGTAFE